VEFFMENWKLISGTISAEIKMCKKSTPDERTNRCDLWHEPAFQFLDTLDSVGRLRLYHRYLETADNKKSWNWSRFRLTSFRGLSQRPNLTEGPAATWDFRRSTKRKED
jgi:hypothetical protein